MLDTVLGYSRRFHIWCTDSADAEHTYEGLLRSFEYFGGVPQLIRVGILSGPRFRNKVP